jgi:hypothetical protein
MKSGWNIEFNHLCHNRLQSKSGQNGFRSFTLLDAADLRLGLEFGSLARAVCSIFWIRFAMGLGLSAFDVPHNGTTQTSLNCPGNPCPEVMQWLDDKDKTLERQIHSLRALQRRVRRFRDLARQTMC